MEATQAILAYALQGLANVRHLQGRGVEAGDFQDAFRELWEQLASQAGGPGANAGLDLQACVEALELKQYLGASRLVGQLVGEGRHLPREAVEGAVARLKRGRLRERLAGDLRAVLGAVETAAPEEVLATTGRVIAELTRLMGLGAPTPAWRTLPRACCGTWL